jgi:hypothetical protein
MRFAAARAYLQFRLDCDRLGFQMLRKRTALSLSTAASRPSFVLQDLIANQRWAPISYLRQLLC